MNLVDETAVHQKNVKSGDDPLPNENQKHADFWKQSYRCPRNVISMMKFSLDTSQYLPWVLSDRCLHPIEDHERSLIAVNSQVLDLPD